MLDEKNVKEAFTKAKLDIFNTQTELLSLKNEINELKTAISDLKNQLKSLEIIRLNEKIPIQNPTHNQESPTVGFIPTDNPTVPIEVKGLKYQNLDISTGNRGVPTNQQTNQQTDNPTHFYSKKSLNQQISDAQDILDSLDNIRKEIRIKFKTITNQEMLVFSTIYQLEQSYPEGLEYSQIASKLKLSSSSIRDYVQRLISKGIPILKIKVNNKKILLKISNELKKIATLETIIKLRDL